MTQTISTILHRRRFLAGSLAASGVLALPACTSGFGGWYSVIVAGPRSAPPLASTIRATLAKGAQ